VILDVGGVGYQVHCSGRTPAGAAPRPGEAAVLSIETLRARGPDQTVRVSRRRRARNGFGCCRRCRASARKSRSRGALEPCRRRISPIAIALRDKAAVTRNPGGRSESRRAHRHRIEGQGAGVLPMSDPALVHLSGAIDHDRAPRPVTDAISALVNLGYGQPQATARHRPAPRGLPVKMPRPAQLIRLGLKELAK